MPFIHVQTIEGLLDKDSKAELFKRLTDLFVEIEGKGRAAFREHIWIRIDEHPPEQWQLGHLKPTKEMIQVLNEMDK
ncbi:tautomerase family protein [Acinetobacter tandoii]|jgi:4-oxalocrotonate tautomerase|uniref:4-oxalocrotonate tautomerase n=2 Tax=Acinetobacter tandoii TaxID=202954 RepID=R9B9T9_9GAMM|nr:MULTISPECIES: tautomerase family protein [Acinetobacter]AUX85179.1 4-oxalocrotonate tautomerase [Acinetobacter sp. ACNIH2]EOR11274.1 4-oxalocrotonate tautomerase [Acinetobacter tandoii DSM 14970 = CIP 107469]KAB1852128.1 4-oxalocrotonate tautomerase [Acinetobacter tandoii]TCB67099.1 4-oxalocrotonate tautomerase [Acinetobacter sp. ANC 4178]UOG16983.1 tautomerase family protein [Acinetobacter sp. PK01]